jgi:hypothetical protein
VPSNIHSTHVIVTVGTALSIVNVLESLLPVWLASPAKLADACPVPALVLSVWVTVNDWLRPPAPVTDAVHGVRADPL